MEPEDDPEEAVDAAGRLGVAVPVPSMPNSGAVVRATFRATARRRARLVFPEADAALAVVLFLVVLVAVVAAVAVLGASAGVVATATGRVLTTGAFAVARLGAAAW